jgi:pimeloyl-ACP methyl ester carboxylesterase
VTDKNCNETGGILYCSVQGVGQPVVLIHGLAASNYDWKYLTPELIDTGYKVIAPDLTGHGNSDEPQDPGCYTFSVLYQHFVDCMDTYGGESEITLVGHSMGGLIALNYAIQNPESIGKLILIDPYFDQNQLNSILRYLNRKPDWYHKALRYTPRWLIHTLISLDVRGLLHYEDRTRKQIAEDYKRASPEIVFIPGTIPDISKDIMDIKSPTLVIWGTNDATLDPNSFPAIVESLPNGHGKAIRGTGHQPHLAQPAEFNRLVLEFLGVNSK